MRVRPACEFDVSHGRFGRGVPQVRAHGSTRQRLEGERSDELLRAGRHDDLHVGVAVLESTRQFGTFVGGNSARDTKHDAHRWGILMADMTHDYGGATRGAAKGLSAFWRGGLRS